MKYDVYGIGNALVDKEFEIEDDYERSMFERVRGAADSEVLRRHVHAYGTYSI